MSKFDAFMAGNVERVENKKVIISNRFKGADGKPLEFEIRAITESENSEMQRSSYVLMAVPGKPGQSIRELDNVKYTAKLMAASVVYPDLNDAELQDSYNVKTPEALIGKMLYMAEYNALAKEIAAFSNIEGLAEMIAEGKN